MEHVCNANYIGPSTGMEAHVIVEGFRRSEEMYGVRYNRLIADGDSSVYKKILDARPYANTHIEKIECRNFRNFRKKMRELIGNTRFLLAHRKLIIPNLKRFSIGILMAIKYRKAMHVSFEEKVELLKKDIENTQFHIWGEHSNCDKYFCTGAKEGEVNHVAMLKDKEIFSKISDIVGRLRINAKSLIYDVDSNRVEHFHALVAKSVGGKRINFSLGQSYTNRCKFAVLRHNTHMAHYELQKSILKTSPSCRIKSVEQSRLNSLNRKRKCLQRRTKITGTNATNLI